MGCLELAFLVLVGIALISLFFFAIEVAFLGLFGALLCGGIGFLFFGVAGLKIGAVIGFVLGVFGAFSN